MRAVSFGANRDLALADNGAGHVRDGSSRSAPKTTPTGTLLLWRGVPIVICTSI
jgi:hypothetical protein